MVMVVVGFVLAFERVDVLRSREIEVAPAPESPFLSEHGLSSVEVSDVWLLEDREGTFPSIGLLPVGAWLLKRELFAEESLGAFFGVAVKVLAPIGLPPIGFEGWSNSSFEAWE